MKQAMKKLISALLMLSALILSCKSNTQNQAQSPVNAGEATSAQAGTLTAYYAKEDFSDVTSDYSFSKGDLICDDNNEFISIEDYDKDNYKFSPEEAEDGSQYGAFIFPKAKAEKVVYNQNQLTTGLVGDRAVFKDKDGNLATIFKSSRNGQPLYIMDQEKWEFEPAPEELLKQFDNLLVDEELDVESVNALLMVKDFDASAALATDRTFMTTADVPALATKEILSATKNPFTGNPLDGTAIKKEGQLVTTSDHWRTTAHPWNTFDTSDGHWYTVHDNIFDQKNWTRVE